MKIWILIFVYNYNTEMFEQQIFKSLPIYGISLSICMGSFVMGYVLVGTSLLQSFIQSYNNIQHEHINYYLSIIITLLPLGAIAGSLINKKLVDKFGEKAVLLVIDVLVIIAFISEIYSLDLWVMYCTRFIFGLFCGISSSIIPVYLTSIAPLKISGIIGSFNQLLITIGIATAYGLDFLIQSDLYPATTQVRIFLSVPIVCSFIRIFVLIFVFPFNTIQRHFKNNQQQKIQAIVDLIYVNMPISSIINIKRLKKQQMKAKNDQHQQNICPQMSIQSQSKNKIILVAIVLALANQLSGINAIFFYAKQLFEQIAKHDKTLVQQYIFGLGLFQIFITLLSGMLLDKFGRRTLMLVGQLIVVSSLLGAYFTTQILDLPQTYIAIFVFCHILGFSLSLGPISMIYASEILQDISLVIILVWVLTFIVASISDYMIQTLGIGKTFLFYGLISLACLIYLFFNMKQTKGLNRQQIQRQFQQQKVRMFAEDLDSKQLTQIQSGQIIQQDSQ